MQKASKIILGIDPGTVIMGYGLIEVHKTGIQLIEMDVLRLPAKFDAYQKLEAIHKRVQVLIQEYQPSQFAIEAPFFGRNVQSMLKLGRAQGVAIAAAMQAGLPVYEYSPKKVKQSITGNGNAAKEQVLKMLQQLLHFEENPRYMDASDALSVAVCHHFQGSAMPVMKKNGTAVKDWKAFIDQNPGRMG